MSQLLCHCDHCPNSTCTIDTSQKGYCYARLRYNEATSKMEKEFNCLPHGETVDPIRKWLCSDSEDRANALPLVRCCNSSNYCNNDQLLPKDLMNDLKKDSNLLLWISLYVGIPFLIFTFIALVMTIRCRARARRRTEQAAEQNYQGTTHPHHHHNHSHAPLNTSQDDNSSDSSPGRVVSDGTVYDTNSMASREPLISNHHLACGAHPNHQHSTSTSFTFNRANQTHPAITCTGCITSGKIQQQAINPINIMFHTNSLNHPTANGGPWIGEESFNGKIPSSFQVSVGTGDPLNQRETSSDSGAGQPYLTQRSIAHDIELVEVVGRGYYGVVWRGDYKGEPVAVKIFSAMAESSWEREAQIYQTTMLRHKNILGFIATDRREDISITGYWLVTEYYPMGSLFDFLKRNSLSLTDGIRMAFSIANGLSHLHMEIFGTQGKPAIAHRDLKSKNILVKNDGTCCIADLGMAVRYNSNTGIVDVPANTRVGTRRYLAPELLDEKLNLMDFDAVKATDVYALGLVLWEILRRSCFVYPGQPINQPNTSGVSDQDPSTTHMSGLAEPEIEERLPVSDRFEESADTIEDLSNDLAVVCEPYEPPYYEYVPHDPLSEEMRQIVCVRKLRPTLSHRWNRFAPMRDFVNVMRECWYEKPQARLSALRVRKTLNDLAKQYFNLSMEYD